MIDWNWDSIDLTELKKQIWNKIAESTFADSDLFYFSSIIFKNITVSLKKQLFRKKCYSWGRTRLHWYRWHWKLRGFT